MTNEIIIVNYRIYLTDASLFLFIPSGIFPVKVLHHLRSDVFQIQ